MAEVGKAYVQIIPSAKGIKGSISNALSGEATSAGSSAGTKIGTNLVKTMTGVLAAAGIGKAITASITEGAALQQSIGGIETLFKENADRVIKYANKAYKTAGLSANDYMENVTSFSASLLQSLGGDTKKAGDAANQAIIDMSDNANKMGTSIESIQNAYQGFAKQNYTMLGNLKLGYGGTKQEMQRLLEDAQKLTGIEYDIDNLNDVYSAIHVIQDELGITGTTAKEAASTFSGSMASMAAAAKNLIGNMALGEDVSDEVEALIDTVKTFVFDNFIPMVENIVKSIPQIIETAAPLVVEGASEMMQWFMENIASKGPELLTTAGTVIQSFLDGITEKLPDLLTKGVEIIKNLADGALQNLPAVITAIGNILNSFINFILENLPTILEKGSELITYLADGVSKNLPYILAAIGQVLLQLLQTILNHLPDILNAGVQLIQSLADGILQIKQAAFDAAKTVAQGALDKIKEFADKMLNAGKEWIQKVIDGIGQMVSDLTTKMGNVASDAFNAFKADWSSLGSNIISGILGGIGDGGSIFDKLKNIASNALAAAEDALGIGSPSKEFRDHVGKWIPEGIAVGIEMNADAVDDAVAALANPQAFDISAYIPTETARQEDYSVWNMTINVYPSEGMDERRLADLVAQRINDQVRRKAAVYA